MGFIKTQIYLYYIHYYKKEIMVKHSAFGFKLRLKRMDEKDSSFYVVA